MNNDNRNLDANRDPLTGAPGAHPVSTGIGAVLGGAAAGAATGTVAGPVGTVAGAAIGAVVGGLAGKGVAEEVNPTRERAYWSANFSGRIKPELGAGQARGARCLESYQPVELTVCMKHIATDSVQRLPQALPGAEPFFAAMEVAICP